MDVYGAVFRSVLYPTWETFIRRRPTNKRKDFLERTQWRSLDEITAMQLGSLCRLLAHAYHHVPFYRARLDAGGVFASGIHSLDDLRKIPILTRQEARDAGKARIARAGAEIAIRKTTGGTTGEPLLFGYDLESEYWRQATKLRGYGWAGYRLGDRTLHYWGTPTHVPAPRVRAKIAVDRFLRREHYVSCTLRSDDELRRVADAIRNDEPGALICYTQAGADLARFIVKNELRAWGTIPVICCAERLFAHDRAALEAAFGKLVFETYGCREVMLIATQCEAQDQLHVSAENIIVEIIVTEADGTQRAAREGELGEVVLTDLHNWGMPFIRYANGDMAVRGSDARCSCGRSLPRLETVEGRKTETLRDAGGARVSGMVFNLIFSVLAAKVRQFQAVQHTDRSITLKVVPTKGAALDADATAHIRKYCEEYLPGLPLRIEVVSAIPTSASGKRQPVLVER